MYFQMKKYFGLSVNENEVPFFCLYDYSGYVKIGMFYCGEKYNVYKRQLLTVNLSSI